MLAGRPCPWLCYLLFLLTGTDIAFNMFLCPVRWAPWPCLISPSWWRLPCFLRVSRASCGVALFSLFFSLMLPVAL